ncbi:tRNA-dihydrouridine(16/17) synthase [NADP(+)]-like [Anaeramoeba flamelloides]|uniref:tRNA-dihydrouridine synthase n=1 Tax=Anaeramoeba flamelloides TaxID=1746091 RepID=A0AAV7YXV4_9EUKA|nr:tRNA-dihydrouridine(16/17) synthase [NADP(+)]-like [Anaeramoeba flamelloides]
MELTRKRTELKKLRGYEFYQSLGSPKKVLAPMVQMSELPFRLYMRKQGVELCYSPMMISKHFHSSRRFRKRNLHFHQKDRPLFVQFAGNDPNVVLKSAQYVENKCDAIDFNMGCPQQRVAGKGHYGSFLLDTEEDRQLCVEIVKKLDQNLMVPVTCKIRLIPSSEDKLVGDIEKTITFAKQLEKAGCAILAVHGRTRFNKGRTMTKTNWGAIARVKESLTIPVIANGSIKTFQDYKDCLKESKADAVMVAMGCLDNPLLFLNKGNDGELNWEKERRVCTKEFLEFVFEQQKEKQLLVVKEKTIRNHIYHIVGKQFFRAPQLRERLSSIEEMVKAVTELDQVLTQKEKEKKNHEIENEKENEKEIKVEQIENNQKELEIEKEKL